MKILVIEYMDDIKQKINQRRRQILVHSYIYYHLNDNIISDHTYDRWCNELVELQRDYSKIAAECVYAKEFEGFDGSTGFDLAADAWIHSTAWRVLEYHKKILNKQNKLK